MSSSSSMSPGKKMELSYSTRVSDSSGNNTSHPHNKKELCVTEMSSVK
jgi:hypothetical protein